MKIAGVSIWIWSLGFAVLMAGAWSLSKRPAVLITKTEEAVELPRPEDDRRNVQESPPKRPVDVELARLRLEGLKQEVERREIEAEARAKGVVLRPRIVRDEETEALSDVELAEVIKKLEAQGDW